MLRRSLPLTLALAACVAKPPASPPPRPTPPAPRPAPAPPPPADWRDRPVAAGLWVYRGDARGGVAFFGAPGANADFIARCDRARRQIYLSRPGTAATRLTLTATDASRAYDALPTGATPPYVAVALDPRDAILDALAFSRGRMRIAVAGGAELILPTWPEFARVVEDCRAP